MIQIQSFKTLIDLLTYFKDEQVCRDYLEMLRWKLSTVAKQLSYKSLTEDAKKEIRWFNDISKSNIGVELKQGSFGF